MIEMFDYLDAIREMYKGNVVKYIGTVNGNVMTDKGWCFCMQRGVIFVYKDGKVIPKSCGNMVYDPDFRYELTGETVDPRGWPNKPKKYPEIKVITAGGEIHAGDGGYGLGTQEAYDEFNRKRNYRIPSAE